MFSLGFGEILVIILVALIFVGPDKIPQTARNLGRWLHELKGAADGLRQTFESEVKQIAEPAKHAIKNMIDLDAKEEAPAEETSLTSKLQNLESTKKTSQETVEVENNTKTG